MLVNQHSYQSIWLHPHTEGIVQIIDQTQLPFAFKVVDLDTPEAAFKAIKNMLVRGAPLIGATAAYGLYLAACHMPTTYQHSRAAMIDYLKQQGQYLKTARPTAINLAWAVDVVMQTIQQSTTTNSQTIAQLQALTKEAAQEICRKDVAVNYAIGQHGLKLIEAVYQKTGKAVQILTHCNAGWLATVDWGTATSPMYQAHQKGIPLHIWVDETRPRNQGSRITAWELAQNNIPHTLITDNTGGLLMQQNQVDMCIVGTDRTTYTGDVANKIGTYLKALAAKDNNIPFYVALPSSTIDWTIAKGSQIPIEKRSEKEVTHLSGQTDNKKIVEIQISPASTPALNYGFDITPARLVTALITERGTCAANQKAIAALFKS